MIYEKELIKWLQSSEVDEATKEEIKNLTSSEAEDCFYKYLEFGTGGLRGVMGVGTNRMNVYTVRHVTCALAKEILSLGRDAMSKGVVVAYDSRMNSGCFACECARVLSANGIKVYLFESLRPTPELSFAVRYLGCIRGVVITASHNPKEYNGYKVYGEDGGQLDPAGAKIVSQYMEQTDIFDCSVSYDNVEMVKKIVDDAYISSVCRESLGIKISENLNVVYTPLHGAGCCTVREALRKIGVKNFWIVPSQEKPDGNFPTVASPNPEDAGAFEKAIEYAKQKNADVILATDPDSDRLGVAVRNSVGEYVLLNGNQTGVLLCEYIAKSMYDLNKLTNDITVIKTIVTTHMVEKITAEYGIKCEDVLTGFKFIGDKIKNMESCGTKENFLFGLEESYGYLKGTYARDKDAVAAAMLMTEIASDCKENGITLLERLDQLYKKYGYHIEKLETRTLVGIKGLQQITEIMARFRNNAGIPGVLSVKDYSLGIDSLPRADVLKFFMEDGSWFAVRPSGTEPKIKFYFGVCADNLEEGEKKIANLKNQIVAFAFGD